MPDSGREIGNAELGANVRELKGAIDRFASRIEALDTRYVMQAVDVERERRWADQVAGLRRELGEARVELSGARDELGELRGLPKELADVRATLRWVSRAAVTGVLFPIIVAVLVAIALRGGP